MRRISLLVGFLLFAAPLASPLAGQALAESGMLSKRKKFKSMKFPKVKAKARAFKSKGSVKPKSFKSGKFKASKFKSGKIKSSSFRAKKMGRKKGFSRRNFISAWDIIVPQNPYGQGYSQAPWISVGT